MYHTKEFGLVRSNVSGVLARSRPDFVRVRSQAWHTHSSASQNFKTAFEVPDGLRFEDYERLEFAGDKVIGWVVAEMIIKGYPLLTPGAATVLMSRLVCEETLSSFAIDYGLLDHLRAAPSVLQTVETSVGARIRGDLFEAYIGAFYREYGLSAVTVWLQQLYAPLVHAEYEALKASHGRGTIETGGVASKQGEIYLNDQAAKFNDLKMRMGVKPSFTYEKAGPDHQPVFTCDVHFDGQVATGTAREKKMARKRAISALYSRLTCA